MNGFLQQSGAGFYEWLWRTSWQSAVLVLLIVCAQWLFRKYLSPGWRSAFWLLLLVRLACPVSLQSPVSIYNVVKSPDQIDSSPTEILAAATESSAEKSSGNRMRTDWLPRVWLAGCVIFLGVISISAWRTSRLIRRERPVTRSAVLDLLEDCKGELGVYAPLLLIETAHVESPLLCGFIRPRLLLPKRLLDDFSPAELRHIFLHELCHLRRGDIPLNWLATVLLAFHWFNPFLWFAFGRMRLDREIACDALALSCSQEGQARLYGETLIRLVEQFSRSAWRPGVVGIIEQQNQMKRRIKMITQSKRAKNWPALALGVFVVLGAITLTEAQSGPGQDASETEKPAAGGSPRIIATSPAIGSKEVDLGINEITVTFDRDMAGGFSWTGGGPEYPPNPQQEKPVWRDKRTCALPVKLEAGHFYRLGINSTSHKNFRSAEGVPVEPTAFYFTTKGATAVETAKGSKPAIVEMNPRNGATDVDPAIRELRVTFNMPMQSGFSWTGGGPEFPPSPEGKGPSWSADGKTCVLPVELKPGRGYRLGLNSRSYKNFQSASGVPLEPVTYSFKTK